MSALYKFKCPVCSCTQLCVEKVYTRSEVFAANTSMIKSSEAPSRYYKSIGDRITGENEILQEEVYFCYNCLTEFDDPKLDPKLFTLEVEQDAH